jgi:N-terminal domain of anti-restriction factor ArdC
MVVSGYQPRVAAGLPAGGQFSTKTTSEVSVDLTETIPASSTGPKLALSDLDKNARIEAMRSEIDRALDELSDPEGWARYLDAVFRFHRYSFANTWLIIAQHPDASRVAGFNDWRNKHNRTVRKGEKAIWVQAPMTKKVVEVNPDSGAEREVSRVYGFRPVPVFDVSQTDGEPLPQAPLIDGDAENDGPAPEGMVESLSELIEADGFRIRRGETREADGWTDFTNHEVVISQATTPRQAARTLAHEAAHIALGHGARAAEYHTGAGGKRPDFEVQADSVAYVLGRRFGMPGGRDSFRYIDSWAQGDKDRVKATAQAVVAGARKIIDRLEAAEKEAA